MKLKKKQKNLLYKTIFIIGLILMFFQVLIYRKTIIDWEILALICLTVGVLISFLNYKDFNKLFNYKNRYSLFFWTFIQNTASWGFIICSFFMFTNYYFAERISIKETFQIVEKSSMTGRKYHRNERKPIFRIKYNNKLKDLVFSHKYYEKMDFYTEVELEVRKGYLGYDILENIKLKEDTKPIENVW